MDLFREIMLVIEEQPAGKLIRQIGLPGVWSKEDVIGHFRLLDQAGFLDGKLMIHPSRPSQPESGHFDMALHGLTNRGHDFLDSIRDETVWEKTKDQVATVGGGAALETIKAVAGAIATAIATAGINSLK